MNAEDKLRADVLQLLDHHGLLWHYCNDSRRCGGPKGFPDLVIAGPRGTIFRELKAQDGDPSDDQQRWGDMLLEPGRFVMAEVRLWAVWRPEDWQSGIIRSELGAIA